MSEKRLVPLMALALTGLCFSLSSIWGYGAVSQLWQQLRPSGQDRICEVASVAAASAPGRCLEGEGQKQESPRPWMDDMQRQGVRRALVRTEFVWRGRPADVTVFRIVYFSKYDTDCAQISDPRQLAQIETRGLPEALGKAAVALTLEGHWFFLDKGHPTKHGTAKIEFTDDGSQPRYPVIFAPSPKTPNAFREAVALDDVAQVRTLLKAGVTAADKDTAIWEALVDGDSCMTKALLDAGVDPNLRNRRGYTPLMVAVRNGSLRNVQTLLASGADVNARAANGDTALSIARRQHTEQTIELLERAGARD